MNAIDTSTPVTTAWHEQSQLLLDDLSRLLEASGSASARQYLLDAAVLQLSARFQAAVRRLVATGAKGIGDTIGGRFGARVQRALTIDAPLAKGYASADDLEQDFERIGIDVWNLDFGPEVPGWVQRGWLNDINQIRDAIAQGIDPTEAFGVVDFAEVARLAGLWGKMIKAFEGAIDDLIETCGREQREYLDALPASRIVAPAPPVGSIVRDRTLIGSGLYMVVHDIGPIGADGERFMQIEAFPNAESDATYRVPSSSLVLEPGYEALD